MSARAVRFVVGGVGVAVAGYGLVLLLGLGFDNLVATLLWVGGGIVVHDAVLAPLTIAVGALVGLLARGRASARASQGPFIVAGVVLASLTVVAVPMLGRFGERPDNPTLLDRDYASGWLIVAALCVAGGIMGTVIARAAAARAAAREQREEP